MLPIYNVTITLEIRDESNILLDPDKTPELKVYINNVYLGTFQMSNVGVGRYNYTIPNLSILSSIKTVAYVSHDACFPAVALGYWDVTSISNCP